MKFSTSITALLSLVPLAMASYDPVRRGSDGSLVARKDDNKDSKNKDGKNGDNNNNNNAANNPTVIIDSSGAVNGINIVGQGNGQVVVIWVNNGAGQPTQTINPQVTVTQTVTAGVGGETATAPPAAAATHEITVGGAAGLVYSPDQIQANVGDMVIFKFQSQNHTITQSTFAEPCVPMAGGMDSGFVPNPNNTITPEPMVAMQVMTTDPIWMYCAQGNHCGSGMTLSINPTLEKTQAQYQAGAIAKFGKGDQTPITGGTPGAAPADPAAPPAGTQSAEATATVPAGATGTQSVAVGTGTVLPDGSCQCVAVCGTDSFPAVAGSFGGISGGLPANMLVIG